MICTLNMLAFDVDGYGSQMDKENSQTVIGWKPPMVRMNYAVHVHSFILNGLKSISHYKSVLKICTPEGDFLINGCY